MVIYSEYIGEDLTTMHLFVSRKPLQAVAPTRIKRKIDSNFSKSSSFQLYLEPALLPRYREGLSGGVSHLLEGFYLSGGS
jgi:hypothetical protein